MITISRSRYIAAAPDAVFATLADPHNFAGIMPRVRGIDLIEQAANHARVATRLALGPFGEMRSEGDVRWQAGREVVFRSRRPISVEARWTLTPAGAGTDLQATLTLDLTPIIGPLAAFIPQRQVATMVGPDLDAALAAIARRLEGQQIKVDRC